MTRPKPTCPGCAVRQRDWLLCQACTGRLCDALQLIPPAPTRRRGQLPWEHDGWQGLLAELELAGLRQTRRASPIAIGGTSSSGPLPYDGQAGDLAVQLAAALTRCCALLAPTGDHPTDPIGQAAWLSSRRRQIRGHPAAGQVQDLVPLVDQCLTVVGPPSPRPDSTDQGRREQLLADALDGLATRSEILAGLPAYGCTVSQPRFTGWIQSGRLQPRGDLRGVPTYRVGDVVALARTRRRVS